MAAGSQAFSFDLFVGDVETSTHRASWSSVAGGETFERSKVAWRPGSTDGMGILMGMMLCCDMDKKYILNHHSTASSYRIYYKIIINHG
jgi:hypothetical protein